MTVTMFFNVSIEVFYFNFPNSNTGLGSVHVTGPDWSVVVPFCPVRLRVAPRTGVSIGSIAIRSRITTTRMITLIIIWSGRRRARVFARGIKCLHCKHADVMDRATAGANNKNIIESIPIMPRRPVSIYVHIFYTCGVYTRSNTCICVCIYVYIKQRYKRMCTPGQLSK